MRSLVRSKWLVVCGDDDALALLPSGGLVIENGLIVDIGDFDALRAALPDAEVLGSDSHLVMPGFVNAHHHVGLTPLQLGSPDMPLELWWISRLGCRPVDLRLDTLYSAFEMVASGITAVQHLHGRIGGPVARMLGAAETVIDAYHAVGMRVSYSMGARDQNRLLYQADETFLQSLPTGLAERVRIILAEQNATLDEYESFVETLLDRHRHDGDVAIQLAPANLHWCSDDALARLRALSERHDLPLHMHLDETRYQRAYAHKRTGGSAVAHLDSLGLLTGNMTLGHGVWMCERDIELVARHGAHLCCNCSSNLRLRSGIAPVNAFLKAGIPVGIGIDEAGINDDRDMLQELRMLLRLNRTPGMDEADVPSPAQVFGMATLGGAGTTPFRGRIGALRPGMAADLVFVDWPALAYPYLDHRTGALEALVQRGRPAHIEMVVVAGEPIYRHGAFVRIDRAAALKALAESLAEPAAAAGAARVGLAAELMPHVRRFYEGYLPAEPAAPYYTFNSRA